MFHEALNSGSCPIVRRPGVGYILCQKWTDAWPITPSRDSNQGKM